MSFTRIQISLCLISIGTLLAGSAAMAVTTTGEPEALNPSPQRPQPYVPNQLLVKFRSEAAASLEQRSGKQQQGADVSESLERLKHRFRLRQTEKVIRDASTPQRTLEGLRKKAPEQLTAQEKRVLQRHQRAPSGARAPAIDRLYLLELEAGQNLSEALEAYRQDPAVEYAEYNYLLYAHRTPSDTSYSIQWPLRNTGQTYPASGSYTAPPGTYDADIDASAAWDLFTGTADVVAAVIDTGVDYTHRDIDENMWVNLAEQTGTTGADDDGNGYVDDIYGYDFINRDGDPMDDSGHGTHCAGVIAAETHNAQDIAGVCWQTRIMALKFLGAGGSGTTANAVKAFYYAAANGADVCSSSWGGGAYSQALEEAIAYATSQGVILAASAGNSNTSTPAYPAYYESMIAVAATDSNDDRASFSNYGSWVDVAAPGVDVLSLRSHLAGSSFGTAYDAYTVVLSGTSMACPHAAGACALLIGANPTLTRDEVYEILTTTGDPIASGICVSDRRINTRDILLKATPSFGRVQFTREEYSCADAIAVILADGDLAGQGTHSVLLTVPDGDTEVLDLTERSSSLGVYDGAIATDAGAAVSGDERLQVRDGQTVTVRYADADDGTGTARASEDTAAIDCAGPVISAVQAAQTGAFWARITLETDEPSRVSVPVGKHCNNLNDMTGADAVLQSHHTVYLYTLRSETTYSFKIVATDEFGNETTDDNQGECYRFTTPAEVPGLHVPMEYPTLQAAIDAALPGETVLAADGIYQGAGNRDLDFGGKAITVRSEYGPEHCVIDCQGSIGEPHCGFYFRRGEGSDSILDGFTITGGYTEYSDTIGGGIVCENSSPTLTHCLLTANVGVYGGGLKNTNSSPAVSHCRFIANAAHLFGGGMDNYDGSHPLVTDCLFLNNLTDSTYSDEWGGGAVGNDAGSHPTFSGCRFEGNFTYGLGAGMYNEGSCSPTLKDCMFVNNDADWGGGGIASDYGYCSPTLVNCQFISNTADQGGGIYCGSNNTLTVVNCLFDHNRATNTGGGIWIYNSSLQTVNSTFYQNQSLNQGGGIHLHSDVTGVISNSIFRQNRDFDGYALSAQISGWMDIGLSYNCIDGWEPSVVPSHAGNINGDPLFLDPDGDDDAAGTEDDNLRLGPGSPCFDAGNNAAVPPDWTDLDNDSNSVELTPWDLDGARRFSDEPNTPDTGPAGPNSLLPNVDIGAYEGARQGFRVEPQQVVVGEGATCSFSVALGMDPLTEIAVTVRYFSGDADITVQDGAALYFDSSTYARPQTVLLAAAEDDDFVNGATWLVIQSQGVPSKKIPVRESDNEPVPPVVYVDAAAAGHQTGLSWADAFTDLQTTLTHAVERAGIAEIRVAQGVYHPAGRDGDRYESFVLLNGLALRGGYAGVRHADPDARDAGAYPTILSGDLNEDDGPEFLNYRENSYHVVTGKGLDPNTVLDGFVIAGGNANGGNLHSNGGGMMNREGSNPVIIACGFSRNLAHGNGSGMYNENSNPHAIRCTFDGNSMGGNSGGGMYNLDSSPIAEACVFIGNTGGVGGGMANDGSGTAQVVRCTFRENQASFGGGLYSTGSCSPVVIDCVFTNNRSDYTGGALEIRSGTMTVLRCRIIHNSAGISDWGGAGIDLFGGSATFESCTIADNVSGENGGGMFVWNGFATMTNCTLSNNTAAGQGGGIYLFSHLSGGATLKNCIVWNNRATQVAGKTITVHYSDIEGNYTGTGNTNEDPRFADAAGGDYHLRWDSPCINTGEAGYAPHPSDIDHEPRVMQGRVDRGSDEAGPTQSDFSRNGIVDMADLSVLLGSWLAADGDVHWKPLCDLYEDQRIDLADYVRFAADWLWQADWH